MTDEDAATWRDLADQLTREQIAKLEEHERRVPALRAMGSAPRCGV